jgi:ubiquinone/menaquinone biosynthesis C-methylase UbiE
MTAADPSRFWNRLAHKYAERKVPDPPAYERTLEHTRRYLKSSDVLLEFGCGTGTTAVKLASSVARVMATDISEQMIAIAREKAQAAGCTNVAFETATPGAAPWADNSFDVVVCFNVLHLIEARAAALAGVRRLLKPGGLFISKTPCLEDANPMFALVVPVMQAFGQAPYVGFLSAAELEGEINAAGFEIVERAWHATMRPGSRRKDPRPFFVARRV